MNKFYGIIGAIFVLCACTVTSTKPIPITQQFDASQVTKVIVRTSRITNGSTINQSYAPIITISGVPRGGSKGYHSSDKNWKETTAEDWGLGFEAKKFGTILVISSTNEIAYMHHGYWLADIQITVPNGVQVILSPRQLTGDGEPDLSEPDFSVDSQQHSNYSISDASLK